MSQSILFLHSNGCPPVLPALLV